MKKYYFAFSTAIITLLSFVSCSKDMDYRKACAEKDWAKAYNIVDAIRAEGQPYKEKYLSADGGRYDWALEALEKYNHSQEMYEEAEKYVVLQEAITVLEESGTNGLMRIVGIAKEHNAESWLYEELLDVARKIGDTDLADRIINIMNS